MFYKAPPIYARGDEVAMVIRLESTDAQAVDLIANPKLFSIVLEQRITVAGDQKFNQDLTKGTVEVCKDCIERGDTVPTGAGKRVRALKGVVNIPWDTKPSFSFTTFVMEHVVILNFSPNSFFVPSNAKTATRISQSIQIVTHRLLPP